MACLVHRRNNPSCLGCSPRQRGALACVFALATACGAPAPGAPEAAWDDPIAEYDAPETPVTEGPGRGLDLTVDASLEAEATLVAFAWSEALGEAIRVVPEGGVWVALVEASELAPAWAATSVDLGAPPGPEACNYIRVSTASTRRARSLAHEVGHCLGARGHAASGLMAEASAPWDGTVDAEAVAQVRADRGY